jgi:hypothetical protein
MDKKTEQQQAGSRSRGSMCLAALTAIAWGLFHPNQVGRGLILTGGAAVLLVALCWSLLALIIHR